MHDDLRRSLALRSHLDRRIQASEVGGAAGARPALQNGIELETLSEIISSPRSRAVAHRQTLEAFDRLNRVVESARQSDERTIELLHEAAQRGSIERLRAVRADAGSSRQPVASALESTPRDSG